MIFIAVSHENDILQHFPVVLYWMMFKNGSTQYIPSTHTKKYNEITLRSTE